MGISERPNIGFVENYIGDKHIVLWFYRLNNEEMWERVHIEKIRVSQRQFYFAKMLAKSSLTPLGRGS